MKYLWFFVVSLSAVAANVCPGGGQCPGVQTCCQLSSGQYGCCPYPSAVCCSDRKHCCPDGYSCLYSKCVQQTNKTESTHLDSLKTLLVKTAPATPANRVCPDPRYSCTGNDTCCRTPAGSWTCCMYPYGNCCADGFHCCPYGMTCLQSSYCVKGNVTIPTQASPFSKDNSPNTNSVMCLDKHVCPDGNTCCKITDDTYGCCPLPNAVCCSDDIHCCPYGFHCNVQSGTCTDGIKEVPWSTKTPTL